MASSSSSFSPVDMIKYEVFLSFRGEDTRHNFLSHLRAALSRKKIETFIDNQLIRGEEISPSLLDAIERSMISVVIFSKGYASSKWCLEELVKILECKNKRGQIVIPVFYHVDPSNVRNQTGIFGDAFSKLEERFQERTDMLQRWRLALREAGNIAGSVFNDVRPEYELIEEVVKDIRKRLDVVLPSDSNDQLVGAESSIEKIESSLLRIGLKNVHRLGIWGIGGIGKTAIARAIFRKISDHFDVSHFIQDIREESEKNGLGHVRQKLISAISEDGNKRLDRNKVLIVLDDVSKSEQIDSIMQGLGCLKPGSRVIITTRDKQVLTSWRVDGIYEVKELSEDDALKLFCRHAFGNDQPDVGYLELSNKILKYAKGVPLALKVLGCFLCGRRKDEWESAMQKLKRIPHGEILEVLKVSYDSLDDEEQNIFLDIACFLNRKDEDFVKKFLNASGFSAEIGISVLVNKCLLVIWGNMIVMHDLLQEMGREIVRQEKIKDPGERSRLWHHKDIYKVFTKNTGTKAIESISLDMSKVDEMHLNTCAFSKMHNLRVLQFYHSYCYGEKMNKVHIPQGLEFDLTELRYLEWYGCPLKSLSSNFRPENLVFLEMPHSSIQELWNGDPRLSNLKSINLSRSEHLIKIPDFSSAKNLERLNFEGCTSLLEIHSSIQYLNKLVVLNLMDCISLESLHTSIHMKSLKQLFLSGCSNLKTLHELPGNVVWLHLDGTAIKELPSSIQYMNKLVVLHLMDCRSLESLHTSIHMESLEMLCLSDCSNLKTLHELPCNIKDLYLDETVIKELPSSAEHLSSLRKLDLQNCSMFDALLSKICKLKNLKTLDVSGCSNLERLPDELGNLEALEVLDAERVALREIPSSIKCFKNLEKLHVRGFKGQEQVGLLLPLFFGFGLPNLFHLSLTGCNIIELPESLGQLSSLSRLCLGRNDFERIPESIKNLSRLEYLNISYCERLQSLPELPCNLIELTTYYCSSLVALSSLPSFSRRRHFDFTSCLKLDPNGVKEIIEDVKLKTQCQATAWWELEYKPDHWRRDPGGSIWLPGSEIPEWFMFKSMGSSINIKATPDLFNDKFLGIAITVVVGPRDLHHVHASRLRVDFKSRLITEAGSDCFYYLFGGKNGPHFGRSDHFLFCFDFGRLPRDWVKVCSGDDDAFFQFYFTDCYGKRAECCEVTKCGVHLISAQEDIADAKEESSRSLRLSDDDDDDDGEEEPQPTTTQEVYDWCPLLW